MAGQHLVLEQQGVVVEQDLAAEEADAVSAAVLSEICVVAAEKTGPDGQSVLHLEQQFLEHQDRRVQQSQLPGEGL